MVTKAPAVGGKRGAKRALGRKDTDEDARETRRTGEDRTEGKEKKERAVGLHGTRGRGEGERTKIGPEEGTHGDHDAER